MAGCGREGAAVGWEAVSAGAGEEGRRRRGEGPRSGNIILTCHAQRWRGGQKVTSKAPFKIDGGGRGEQEGERGRNAR